MTFHMDSSFQVLSVMKFGMKQTKRKIRESREKKPRRKEEEENSFNKFYMTVVKNGKTLSIYGGK